MARNNMTNFDALRTLENLLNRFPVVIPSRWDSKLDSASQSASLFRLQYVEPIAVTYNSHFNLMQNCVSQVL